MIFFSFVVFSEGTSFQWKRYHTKYVVTDLITSTRHIITHSLYNGVHTEFLDWSRDTEHNKSLFLFSFFLNISTFFSQCNTNQVNIFISPLSFKHITVIKENKQVNLCITLITKYTLTSFAVGFVQISILGNFSTKRAIRIKIIKIDKFKHIHKPW